MRRPNGHRPRIDRRRTATTGSHDGLPRRTATTDDRPRPRPSWPLGPTDARLQRLPPDCNLAASSPHACRRRHHTAPPPYRKQKFSVRRRDAPAAAAQEKSYLVSSLGRMLVTAPRLPPRPSDSLSPFAQPPASAGVPTPVGDISLVFPLPPTPPARILRHGVTSPDGLTTAASNKRADRAENSAASHPAAAAKSVADATSSAVSLHAPLTPDATSLPREAPCSRINLPVACRSASANDSASGIGAELNRSLSRETVSRAFAQLSSQRCPACYPSQWINERVLRSLDGVRASRRTARCEVVRLASPEAPFARRSFASSFRARGLGVFWSSRVCCRALF